MLPRLKLAVIVIVLLEAALRIIVEILRSLRLVPPPKIWVISLPLIVCLRIWIIVGISRITPHIIDLFRRAFSIVIIIILHKITCHVIRDLLRWVLGVDS